MFREVPVLFSNDILRQGELLPLARRWFFEQLTAGLLTPDELRETARELDIELEAQGYAIALFTVPAEPRDASAFFSDPGAAVRSAILAHFLKYSDYVLFHWGPETCAVLIKADAGRLDGLIARSIETVRSEYDRGGIAAWHIAVSEPLSGLEELPDCFRELSRLWAWRYVQPQAHVLRPGMTDIIPVSDGGALDRTDPALTDPSRLLAFLENGRQEEVPAFAEDYLRSLGEAVGFLPFLHYILLGARFAAGRYAAALGLPREAFLRRLPAWTQESAARPEEYLSGVLTAALALRDEVSGEVYPGALGRAARYIHDHFTDPVLTLEQTARHAQVTPGYLSALFRRKLGQTFTEYVTGKRIQLAKRLLHATDQRPGDVARAVGFRDTHYFSTVFKKVTGQTPTGFRVGKERRPVFDRS